MQLQFSLMLKWKMFPHFSFSSLGRKFDATLVGVIWATYLQTASCFQELLLLLQVRGIVHVYSTVICVNSACQRLRVYVRQRLAARARASTAR